MEWISVEDELPIVGQPILFVNDISRNEQDMFIHILLKSEKDVTSVRFGFVYESVKEDNRNFIQTGVLSEYCSVTGFNGLADHISHWMPLPSPPTEIKL